MQRDIPRVGFRLACLEPDQVVASPGCCAPPSSPRSRSRRRVAPRAAQAPPPRRAPAARRAADAHASAAPAVRATGVSIPLRGAGLARRRHRRAATRDQPAGWITIKTAPGRRAGRADAPLPAHAAQPALRAAPRRRRPRLDADHGPLARRHAGRRSATRTSATACSASWPRAGRCYPWRGVAPTLRRADIAFGNLECAISDRGAPSPKEYNFRGRPRDLAAVVRFAGLDVLNLANNHAGDFGMPALLDTVRAVRDAGRACRSARAPRWPRRAAPAGHHAPRPAGRVRRLLGHRPGVVLRRPGTPGHLERDVPGDRRGRPRRAPPGRRRRRDVPLGRRARDAPRTPASARSRRRRSAPAPAR